MADSVFIDCLRIAAKLGGVALVLGLFPATAQAQTPQVTFQSGPWTGAAISNSGTFVFCAMTTTYNIEGTPYGLTVGLDRANEWAVSIYSNQLSLPTQKIDGQLTFDSERPIAVQADVRNPRTASFLLRGMNTVDAQENAKKLTIAFLGKSLTFDLPGFVPALQHLRECRETNNRLAAATPTPAPPPAAVAAVPPAPTAPAPAAPANEPPAKPNRHFASFAVAKVDLRGGPEAADPVQWTYQRKGLPVAVVDDSGLRKKIRDPQGTEGWVEAAALSDERTASIAGIVRTLRHDPRPDGAPLATLEPGAVAQILRCDGSWCEIAIAAYRGWVEETSLFGVDPSEKIAPPPNVSLEPTAPQVTAAPMTPSDASARIASGLQRLYGMARPLIVIYLVLVMFAGLIAYLVFETARLRRVIRSQAKLLVFYRAARTDIASTGMLAPLPDPAE